MEKPSRFYALIDVETTSENAQSKVDGWLEDLMADEIVVDGLIADASESQKEVWALRESITESLQMSGAVRKYDLCVPVKKAADFLDEAQALFEKLNLPIELYVFGHFGDGSPHLNFLNAQNLPIEDFHREVNRYESELYPLLKAYSGSVSAEHGVGILKKNWVLFSRTPQELRLYKAVKQVFDPNGILNPGKIID
ncbi:MAG: hypothetical protein EB078_03355 [Proteobacteria bacterium]|nr:hypothetical protein [Pseudomonadota bacterium]NDD03919.1 hypothetical protein [Pseudomonadota bacterium]